MDGLRQTIGMAFGGLLIGWACVEGLVFSIGKVAARMRFAREYERSRADFRRRVEAAALQARATKAIPDWSGWRPFRVAAIVDESRDVKSFYFTPSDGRPLAPFAPGQYLTFRLPAGAGSAPIVRCYSLSDRPRQDYYRATIKRIAAPAEQAGAPPGRGSNFFHESVHVGDTLDIRAPAGTFLVDPLADEPIVLVGAGIGVTPLVSMLEAVAHSGRAREMHVLFGFRNGAEHPFRERLASLAAAHPNVRLHVSYSAPRDSDVLYRDYNHRGRITAERVRQVLPSNNYRFYVCGPGGFMESLVPALWRWGVPESHVQYEAFGPSSVKRIGRYTTGNTAIRCEVRFERSGRDLTWDGSFASLLEFGEAAGITMPSGCRAGSCGECMVAIRAGTTTAIKPPNIPVPPEHCLACISAPAEALVLDA